ncbi:MAG: hypothetical protein KF802_06715 [Bdellovibrionaceae bacterium]|nr:hypothetical protein [Pseudobdellovibrionaceae bacterium]MBX3034402.1 hypothetical protein [Pseudobdellovibrionaceae bacterium]
MNHWRQKILQLIEDRKELLLWLIFIAIGATAAALSLTMRQAESPAEAITSLETFIPRDHLLIPVEIANADKLEGILGANGIVDLYVVPAEGGPARLVGRRLRLLRAPLNPQAFAVLLKESEADRFLSNPGPYIASVRPLNEKTHEVARPTPGPRIDYQQE